MFASLEQARAVCERFADQGLSALLALQLALIFLVEPLAAVGLEPLLVVTKILATGLIFALVLGSRQRGALIVVIFSGAVRIMAHLTELLWPGPATEVADAIGAMLVLLAVTWVIFGVVFGPGPITSHRVRGAIVLYLTIALVFGWLYLLIAAVVPGAFSGLVFQPDDLAVMGPFVYYSMTALTTVGFGDITPVNAFARNLTMLEALIGQLYPAIILARILTLYASTPKRDR